MIFHNFEKMYSTFTIKSIDVRMPQTIQCIARNSMGFDKQFVCLHQRLDYTLYLLFCINMNFKIDLFLNLILFIEYNICWLMC